MIQITNQRVGVDLCSLEGFMTSLGVWPSVPILRVRLIKKAGRSKEFCSIIDLKIVLMDHGGLSKDWGEGAM